VSKSGGCIEGGSLRFLEMDGLSSGSRADLPAMLRPSDLNTHRLLYSHCADNHPEDSPVEFCLSFWNVLAGASDADWSKYNRERVLAYWTRYATLHLPYIGKRNYKRIDGRPVLFRGYVHRLPFFEQFNVTPREITEVIRSVIPNAYLVATATERETYPLLKGWGFDAFTEYLLQGSSWTHAMETYRWSWNQGIATAAKHGLDYWVPATSGYDASAWPTAYQNRFIPSPVQFRDHLIEAREFARRNFVYTRGQVLTYSWNEFGEQETPIEPTVLNGSAYLDAHREACA
jgi:hypothetical protein